MHLWEIMISLGVGILGGIISSIIVTRVFSVIGSVDNQIQSFEKNFNKLMRIRGMLCGIRYVMEFAYDSELRKEKEMKQKGFKSEPEYYSAHKDIRWIDADVLVKNLLNECKKWSQELSTSIAETTHATEIEIEQFYKDTQAVLLSISGIKEATFDLLEQIDLQIKHIEEGYEGYKKSIKRVYFKNIISDKIVLAICCTFILIVVATIFLFLNNI